MSYKLSQYFNTRKKIYQDKIKINIKNENIIEIPKEFWRYYDFYRRGKITIDEFSKQSELEVNNLLVYISSI